tara:strand:+ start:41 stop:688 length:648 start_codon:yes stop_codon:yes gene_type:complete
MVISNLNCKKIFQEAYENRYTWPKKFSGYKGKFEYSSIQKVFNGDFVIGNNFKPEINNIYEENIVKLVSSQLFEVAIHRVKREFKDIHSNNEFEFLSESENGIKMRVSGKNEGDKYQILNKKINMVFRKIHGVIIEIFVEDFLDTGKGFLSSKYTSQQIDPEKFSPKSKKVKYVDNFIRLKSLDIWVLESRDIYVLDENDNEILHRYVFRELSCN